MSKPDMSRLSPTLDELPSRFKGPGGAVAILKDGRVVAREAWGYADLKRHVPFSPKTLVPICSISKQFTCAVLLDQFADPAQLDGSLKARLPALQEKAPRIIDLCHNQSGLRDYWALTVLCGAVPEGDFRPADAKSLIGRNRTLHFSPGTQYSYSNGNFRLLSDLIEDHAGRPFADILHERVLKAAGMKTAIFSPETSDLPGGAIGYEGDDGFGFVPAVNRINWTGDAGMAATLDDMIAWESFIDRTYGDTASLYKRLAARPRFTDGTEASYGFGLAHMESDGVAITGHGGALRGWRAMRLHAAKERLSVIVFFNHAANARDAAFQVLRAALGQNEPSKSAIAYNGEWSGAYYDPATDLLLDVTGANGGKGQLSARFATDAETLDLTKESEASSPSMTLKLDGDALHMTRPVDNLRSTLKRINGASRDDVAGLYHCPELDSRFHVMATGRALYGAFKGFLGQGAMQPLYPVGADIWRLPCQRSMDAPSPGDWTVHFRRNGKGAIAGATIGCWLARKVSFEKRE